MFQISFTSFKIMRSLFIADKLDAQNESCTSIIMIYWRRESVNSLQRVGIGQFPIGNFPGKNFPGGIS